jgi:hypothetical protein
MKMSYKRAWQLIEALNACFREPRWHPARRPPRRRLAPDEDRPAGLGAVRRHLCPELGRQRKELRRLHGLLK